MTRSRQLRFGDYELQPDTGELRRVDGAPTGPTAEAGAVVRLAPQPAKLLAMLLERRGALLERDEIRRALWPETHVDFDQSLAFCMRQLRAALEDSAAAPRYIETLPRRGFRLLVAVTELEGQSGPGSTERPSGANRPSRRSRAIVGLAAAALLAAGGLTAHRLLAPASRPVRLAIMPFELAAVDAGDGSRLARISEWLVVELAREPSRLEVIGPRTTAAYHGTPFPDLSGLGRDLEIDYAINCRYLGEGGEPTLLVELIRLDDGAHPWVDGFGAARPWLEVAETVRAGVEDALLPSR
ncbi:MAG TPA: winged helix-turn-helix domain-containing protein [Thermohalobaculum sp.]|nr:winged helix-turn-helix domain-containing protein [Thermohalobaculum sp.]